MSVNNFIATGKFIAATKPKPLSNGKNVRSFYLDMTDNPEYPNTPEFNLYGDKCSIVDGIKKDQPIEVTFNLSGKKYKSSKTGKDAVFTGLQAWKVDLIEVGQEAATQTASSFTENDDDPDTDDLPF